FTLAQLGLMGLVLRDLNDGWFGLGFAKSRGLGTVSVQYNQATVQYPGCILTEDNQQISLLGSDKTWKNTMLLGAGEFLDKIDNSKEEKYYGFPTSDHQETPVAAQLMDLGFGVKLTFSGEVQVKHLFSRSVEAWKQLLQPGVA
ncbi:MAG: CRISPR-associated protein, partial [Cyanobacteriota bacterium]|nr:CRISPR-associated protein [Cyanobacteriota bacterium]